MNAAASLMLEVLLDGQLAGHFEHEPASNQFAFRYAPSWLANPAAYPLGPGLPLAPNPDQDPSAHSLAVRVFFENLLPEGRALDEAASAHGVAKSNLPGLILALGRETSGALSLRLPAAAPTIAPDARRRLPREELSERIRARPWQAFSVWDGTVRLSIAGFQDKISVWQEHGDWFLVEGAALASTVILKPEPPEPGLAGLVSNEFFCMRLAKAIGLPVAEVELLFVPEPVLAITRFDRLETRLKAEQPQVQRLHIFDGCQALGLASALKYERAYGDGPDVRHLRSGASLVQLFALLAHSQNPAAQKLQLLRWVLFQILIGNTDAHAKNLSFFSRAQGFALTPAYDLVSTLAFERVGLAPSFAMAIGDAFLEAELSALEWAWFARQCGLSASLVAQEMRKMLARLRKQLTPIRAQAVAAGAQDSMLGAIQVVIERQCLLHEKLVGQIAKVHPDLL